MADLAVLVRQLQGQIDELTTARIGTVVWRVTDEQADDELFVNGQQVTNSFPILRAQLVALGNPHGSGGGNPLLPDLRGKFAAGAGGAYALGAAGGADSVTLTGAQSGVNGNGTTGNDSPDHTHLGDATAIGAGAAFTTGVNITTGGGAYGRGAAATGGASARHQHALTARNADSSHENRPPYVALWPFVKAA